jgi:drug/metabolite transporter (DMT)-like permease
MPVFVYACPVTACAAALLTLAALAADGQGLVGGGQRHGVVGWAASGRYAPLVAYLAVGPGLVGHTGFNTLLRYMSPLMVGLATQLETVVAPVIGWLAGVAGTPGWPTYAGGAMVLAATVAVTLAAGARERREEERAAGFAALGGAFRGYSALTVDDLDAPHGGLDDQLAEDEAEWIAKG